MTDLSSLAHLQKLEALQDRFMRVAETKRALAERRSAILEEIDSLKTQCGEAAKEEVYLVDQIAVKNEMRRRGDPGEVNVENARLEIYEALSSVIAEDPLKVISDCQPVSEPRVRQTLGRGRRALEAISIVRSTMRRSGGTRKVTMSSCGEAY